MQMLLIGISNLLRELLHDWVIKSGKPSLIFFVMEVHYSFIETIQLFHHDVQLVFLFFKLLCLEVSFPFLLWKFIGVFAFLVGQLVEDEAFVVHGFYQGINKHPSKLLHYIVILKQEEEVMSCVPPLLTMLNLTKHCLRDFQCHTIGLLEIHINLRHTWIQHMVKHHKLASSFLSLL